MEQDDPTSYRVYRNEHGNNHHSLYVETDTRNKTGFLYHVVGRKMLRIEIKASPNPKNSPSIKSQKAIGWLKRENKSRFDHVCLSVPSPRSQSIGGKDIYPGEPLGPCQEWIAEVIQALKIDEVLSSFKPV